MARIFLQFFLFFHAFLWPIFAWTNDCNVSLNMLLISIERFAAMIFRLVVYFHMFLSIELNYLCLSLWFYSYFNSHTQCTITYNKRRIFDGSRKYQAWSMKMVQFNQNAFMNCLLWRASTFYRPQTFAMFLFRYLMSRTICNLSCVKRKQWIRTTTFVGWPVIQRKFKCREIQVS